MSVEPAPDEYVFPRVIDGRDPMRPDDFSDRWGSPRGFSVITYLQLRHYAATTMLDAGESYHTVADILGNSEATLRLHYDDRSDVGKRRAIAHWSSARTRRHREEAVAVSARFELTF